MLTEENPEAFASPEQKHEDDSKKKKKRKKKKKDNENPAQPNQHPQPEVWSEPLVVALNQEIKSNEESSLPDSNNTPEKKKKKPRKKKSVINAEEPKPLLDLENKKEVETVEVAVEGAKTPLSKRKRKSDIGKLIEVVVVENALKHDQEQLNTVDTEEKKVKKHKRKKKKSELDGSQASEQNIKPAEIAVQTSIIDREVPAISVNTQPANLAELENKYLDREMKKRKRKQLRSKGEEKTQEHNGKTIEIQVQRPIDSITEPSTDSVIILDPHPATPIDAEQKIVKKSKKKRKLCGSETPALKSINSTTVPSTVPIDAAIPTDLHPTIQIDAEQKIAKKPKKKKKGESNKSDGGEKTEEHNGKLRGSETPAQKSINSTTAPSTVPIDPPPIDTAIPTDLHPATPIDPEQKIAKKPKKKKKKGESNKSDGGEKTEEHNGKLRGSETPAQKSINSTTTPSTVPIDPPPIDAAIPTDLHPATPIDPEQKIAKKPKKKKKKGESNKSDGGEKTEEHNGKLRGSETPAQKSVNSTTAPSTVPIDPPPIDAAIPTDLHPATPIDPEQKIAKKPKKKKKKGESNKSDGGEKTEEHNGKLCGSETPAQKSINSTTAPSTVPIDPPPIDAAIPTGLHPATPVEPEQKTSKKKKSGLKSEALESDRLNAGSTAETSVQVTKEVEITKAPPHQHGESSMICWACRAPNHTIEQCQKLKCLSWYEEICFFCGEIGHSLGRCSVYIAGGGRLARCLFCNAHGHFSYNCPGNGHYPKEQLPVEAERKIQC